MEKDVDMQKKSFDWYIQNLNDLAAKYPEKFIAIKDCKVLGAYSSFNEALEKTEKQGYVRGAFIVQKASLDPNAYTVVYYNNLIKAVI